jgi:Immunity protein family (Imm11)
LRSGKARDERVTMAMFCGGKGLSGESAHGQARQRKPKTRKFYIITFSTAHKLADFEIENLDVLCMGARVLAPPPGRRGFPAYPERPRVVIGKRGDGPPPSDLELFHNYWLISDRLKAVFETVDPPAFAFQACDVKLRDGSPGPVYWLCDVVRVLEAFGESTLQEIRQFFANTGHKSRGFLGDPPEYDRKRCFYRTIMVSDGKVTESAVVVGSGTIWGGEPTSYPNLEGGYESIAFDVPGRPTGHIHVELPDTGSVPIIEDWSSGEMSVSSCKKIEP